MNCCCCSIREGLAILEISSLIQAIAEGFLVGGLYAVASVGVNVVWGVMRIVNFAHGAIVILGTFSTYYLFTLFGIDPILSLILTVPIFFVIGMSLQSFLVKPVERRTAGTEFENTTLIIFFALGTAMELSLIHI